jgi:hypothetical protein
LAMSLIAEAQSVVMREARRRSAPPTCYAEVRH